MPAINQCRLAASLLAVAILAAPPSSFGKRFERVDSVAMDPAGRWITIRGIFFGDHPPAVYLGGNPVPLAVRTRTARSLEVLLPQGIAPGTYPLVVGDDHAFAVTVGPVGPVGDAGPAGPAGIPGEEGPRGRDATLPVVRTLAPGSAECTLGGTRIERTGTVGLLCNGADGAAGADGDAGPAGAIGEKGPTGATGPVGPLGARGPAGDNGPAGPVGLKGEGGDPGVEGPMGYQGAWGPMGPQGADGPRGPTSTMPGLWHGAAGPPGGRGPSGTSGQWANGGGFPPTVLPYGGEVTIAIIPVVPGFSATATRGSAIVRLSVDAVMTEPWAGCLARYWFVIPSLGISSLRASRYLPRNAPRQLGHAYAIPDRPRASFEVHVMASADCPGTELTRIHVAYQWLNQVP